MSLINAKENLVNYLYEPIAAAIQQWQPCPRSDIYGIWIDLSLPNENSCTPVISSISYLSITHLTNALRKSYGSAFAPGCATDAIYLNLCEETGDWYGDSEHLGDPEGRALRNEYFASIGVPSVEDSRVGCLEAFLTVCGEVIRQFHQEGIIESVCGKSVPIGITCSNDIDQEIALAPTRDANPSGLSREMEEWMMQITYAQKEAREVFFAEMAARPLEEQAEFWIDALIAEKRKLHGKQDSSLATRLAELQILGMRDIEPQFRTALGPVAVPRLIEELKQYANVHCFKPKEPGYTEKWVASGIANALIQVGSVKENQVIITQSTISQLHQLLTHLFHEGESLETVDIVASLVAGILNTFRPEQYPIPISGPGGAQANRLLNWRDFGLERSNPNTPEYHPDRSVMDEAYERFQHSLKENKQ